MAMSDPCDGFMSNEGYVGSNNGVFMRNRFESVDGANMDVENKESSVSSENFITVNRKRARTSTGENNTQYKQFMSDGEYEKLPLDGKLSILFKQMNNIGQRVEDCVSLTYKVNSLKSSMHDHDRRLKRLEYKSIDLEARSRRNNLLFGGISEQKGEDAHSRIATFLKNNLDIDPCPVIPRAHRLGPYRRGYTRPIIVYFLDYTDVNHVLSKANKLRGTDFNINRDFPREIVNARKHLWPEYKELRKSFPASKISILYPAKLVKDGNLVKDQFPDWVSVMQGPPPTLSKTNDLSAYPVSNPEPPSTQSDKSFVERSDDTPTARTVQQHKSRRTQSQCPHPIRGRNHAPPRRKNTSTTNTASSSIQRPWTSTNITNDYTINQHQSNTFSESQNITVHSVVSSQPPRDSVH